MKQGETSPLIIAHRGDSSHAPENTLAALHAAIAAGADGVEFDVRLASDGVPVVIHDATLKRTAGLDANVADLTSRQLTGVDVGSRFDDRYPKRSTAKFAGESVPTLEQVLDLVEVFKGLIYIELKCGRTNVVPLVDVVCSIIRDSLLLERVIVKSFRLSALSEVRRRLPAVRTAALFDPSIANVLRRRSRIVDIALNAGAQHLSVHRSLATARLARAAHRVNMPVTVWTVDDPKWVQRCQRLGVAALITNDPARMLAARDEDR